LILASAKSRQAKAVAGHSDAVDLSDAAEPLECLPEACGRSSTEPIDGPTTLDCATNASASGTSHSVRLSLSRFNSSAS
jgi:hypothetical protein